MEGGLDEGGGSSLVKHESVLSQGGCEGDEQWAESGSANRKQNVMLEQPGVAGLDCKCGILAAN